MITKRAWASRRPVPMPKEPPLPRKTGYNLNHLKNMISLPHDSIVATTLKLPRHLATSTARDHPTYSKQAEAPVKRALASLKRVAKKTASDGKCDSVTARAAKATLDRLSASLYSAIKAWGVVRAGSAPLDLMPPKLFVAKESNK